MDSREITKHNTTHVVWYRLMYIFFLSELNLKWFCYAGARFYFPHWCVCWCAVHMLQIYVYLLCARYGISFIFLICKSMLPNAIHLLSSRYATFGIHWSGFEGKNDGRTSRLSKLKNIYVCARCAWRAWVSAAAAIETQSILRAFICSNEHCDWQRRNYVMYQHIKKEFKCFNLNSRFNTEHFTL